MNKIKTFFISWLAFIIIGLYYLSLLIYGSQSKIGAVILYLISTGILALIFTIIYKRKNG